MKLKRNIAIAFACYYMMICVGLTLTVHFCGGMLAGVSAVTPSEKSTTAPETCCVVKAAANEDCCNDAVIDLSELEDDTLISTSDVSNQIIALLPVLPSVVFEKNHLVDKRAQPNYTYQSNAPPLYKLYSTYIFYG